MALEVLAAPDASSKLPRPDPQSVQVAMSLVVFFIVFAVLAGFGLGVAVSFAAFQIWRRARQRKIREPVCARCGYVVRGIAELRCPECGSDLREVGIIAPGPRKRRRSSQNPASPFP